MSAAGVCACDPDLHHAQTFDRGKTWVCGHCGELRIPHPPAELGPVTTDPGACQLCSDIDAGVTGFCKPHGRAQLRPDAPADVAKLIRALAEANGIEVTEAVEAQTASIHVDVAEVNGERVVKLVLPVGSQAVAIVLPPDTAIALARVLISEAKKAKSPSGLILPG